MCVHIEQGTFSPSTSTQSTQSTQLPLELAVSLAAGKYNIKREKKKKKKKRKKKQVKKKGKKNKGNLPKQVKHTHTHNTPTTPVQSPSLPSDLLYSTLLSILLFFFFLMVQVGITCLHCLGREVSGLCTVWYVYGMVWYSRVWYGMCGVVCVCAVGRQVGRKTQTNRKREKNPKKTPKTNNLLYHNLLSDSTYHTIFTGS